MASIHKERRNGKTYYRLQFYDKDNRRRSMRLGKISKKAADAIKAKVEDLISASISGASPSNETSKWLAELGNDLADKLTNAGLGSHIPKRESATLGAFLESFIAGRTSDSAENTIRNFRNTQKKLTTFFGEQRDLRTITEGDADDWRQSLCAQHAEATLNKHVKRARQFFRMASRKGLVESNPFAEVKGGSEQNDSRKHFVERKTVEMVLEACPDTEWRLIVALARYGGVRTPSEVLSLRWGDIDWDRLRFTVTSPKTKKQGKPYRVVPLFPELKPFLADAFDQAEDGAEFVITRYRDRNSNLRTQLLRIMKRAGVAAWPKLFQNLRASRETELANTFPLHVVTEWLGNTPTIAAKHYLQTTEQHYRDAVVEAAKPGESGGATVGAVVVQQSVPSASSSDCQELSEPHHPRAKKPGFVSFPGVLSTLQAPPRGVEPLSSD